MHATVSQIRWSFVVLSVMAALAGCGGEPQAPAATAPEPAAPVAPAPAPAAPTPAPAAAAASDRVDDASFELALKPTGAYAAGKVQSFALSLKPKSPYHVNQDYPFSVSLTAQGVTFPKAELGKGDAAKFDEKLIELDVPFTAAAAGQHSVSALVKFAVCTPETCVPDERTLALALSVE